MYLTPFERFVSTCCEAAVNAFAVRNGMTSGEVSSRKAVELYGKWFKEAVAKGRLFPCRVGDGANSTKWYSIEQILRLRAEDEAPAEIKNLIRY